MLVKTTLTIISKTGEFTVNEVGWSSVTQVSIAWHISCQKAAQEIPTTTQEQDEAVILVAHLKIAKGPGWS